MKSLPLLAFAAMAGGAVAAQPSKATIDRYDPAFDALVAKDAVVEKLADGFRWSEGPVWYQNSVVFSDVPTNIAHQWKPGTSGTTEFLNPSGGEVPVGKSREPGSNGLAVDAQGRLLLCQHGARRVARYEDGKFTVLADRYDGKRFSSPNDLALRRNGEIYFTDPPYGLEGLDKSPLKEQPVNGVYRLGTDGKVTLLIKDLTFPNGIAFSPDEKVLYVNISDSADTRVMAYDVKPDGTVGNGRVFFSPKDHPRMKPGPGGFDGLKVDRDGNLWSSGPGGILVISPKGALLGRINTGVPTANCGWGDDGGTLYITANNELLRVKTLTKGAGW